MESKKDDWNSLRLRQVRWDDQSQYHQEIESVFVGGRLSFLLPPPAFDEFTSVEKWTIGTVSVVVER